MTEISNLALTHGGKFHADDVFAGALLKILNPQIEIKRVFKAPDNFDGTVFDIGLGKFDHHQENSEIRDNGVPYAAFGLLFREFGERIMKEFCSPEQAIKEVAHFDENFIQPLDLDDNTGCGNQLASVIGVFNPSWDSDESPDECYQEAVKMAKTILEKKFDSIKSIQNARSFIQSALAKSKDNIVILQKFAPWKSVLVTSEAIFVVYPSQRGGFSAQGIPKDNETRELKCYFPESWAGKTADELKSISGIETITFCHKGRFLISCDTLEDTLKACELAKSQQNA